MTKKRIPRKLKKGMKTLFHSHRRTKWHRRANVIVTRIFIYSMANAIITSAWRKFVEGLEPGGIVAPSSEPPSNEMVLNRDQIQALKDQINEGCNGAITATIEGDQLAEGLNRMRCRTIIK